jgi:hypothetical protein
MNIIIGSGLTGLWLGYQFYKSKIDFVILEKNPYIGGKVTTEFAEDGTQIEYGPSVIHSNQHLIMNLLKELKISTFKSNQPKIFLNQEDEKYCKKIELPKQGKGKVNDVIPYYERCSTSFDEIKDFNYNTWRRSENDVGDVVFIKGGFKKVVDSLGIILKSKIKLNQEVVKVDIYDKILYTNDKLYNYSNVILCTTSIQARKLFYDTTSESIIKSLSTSVPVASSRLYIEFREDYDMKPSLIVGGKNTEFGFAIPMSSRVIMASYIDGEKSEKSSKESLEGRIQKISKELGFNIDDIQRIWYVYYKDAFERVPSYITDKECKESIEMYPCIFQTFVPDAFRLGQDQSWVESQLQTAYNVFISLFYHSYI